MKIILTESQLDKVILREQETCDVFTNQTTAEDYDDILSQDPHRFLRTMVGRIVQISPDEYFDRCAQLQDTTYHEQLSYLDKPKVRIFAQAMTDGQKFDMPYINYSAKQQEGRHRVAGAKLMGCSLVNIAVFNKQDGEDPYYEGWDEQPEYTLEDLEDKLPDVFLSDQGAYVSYIHDWTHPKDIDMFIKLFPKNDRDILYHIMGYGGMDRQTNEFEFDIDHFVPDEDLGELTKKIGDMITSVVSREELVDLGVSKFDNDFNEVMAVLLNLSMDYPRLKPLERFCHQMLNSVFHYGYLETNSRYFLEVDAGYRVEVEKSVIRVYSTLKYHFDHRVGTGKELLIENDVKLTDNEPYMPENNGFYLVRARDVKTYLQQYPIS